MTVEEFLEIKYITASQEEKETIITDNIDGLSVYTTDSVYLHKLQKLIMSCPAIVVSINETHNRAGEVTSIDCDMNDQFFAITMREKRRISEKQLAHLRANASALHQAKA